jgi:uncharacterized membrane protein HdeD (DUF308 family)
MAKPSQEGEFVMTTQAVASAGSPEAVFGEASKNWIWLLSLGILFIILGVIGLGRLFALSLAGAVFFGVLIIIGGVAQFIEAVKCTGWKSLVYHVLIGVLYVVGGVFVIWNPLAAKLLLTWVLSAVLICVGVIRVIMAFQMRATGSWFIPLLGGIVSIILGGLIMANWPLSGLFVIGLFIAIELITNGWSYIFIALAARNAGKTAQA